MNAVPAGWHPDPNQPGQQRYWDGTQWSEHTSELVKLDDTARKAIMDQQVANYAAQRWRIESRSDFQAVFIGGKKRNDTLHVILTVFTCLLWGIVWAIVAASTGEARLMVTVDPYGQVTVQDLGKL